MRDRRRARVLLFDPLAVPSEILKLAADRERWSCSRRTEHRQTVLRSRALS